MAWGTRSGVADLLQKLQEPATAANLYVLSSRKLSEEDITKLAHAISASESLKELSLSGRSLSDASVSAIAEALAKNTSLRHISIGNSELGDSGVEKLCSALESNSNAQVESWDLASKNFGDAGADALSKLLTTNTSLRQLNIASNPVGGDGLSVILEGIISNPKTGITQLELADTKLTGRSFASLASLLASDSIQLAHLDISVNDFSSTTSEALAKSLQCNTTLETLIARECQLQDEFLLAFADAVASNASIRSLDLSENAFTSASMTAFADGLKENSALERLVLSNNKGLGDQGATAVAQALASSSTSKLEKLDLSNTDLSVDAMIALLACPSIKELRLFENKLGHQVDQVIDALRQNRTIELLDLGGNGLDGQLSVSLFDALHDHPSLKTLEMGGNKIGEEGHAAIARLHEVNPSLDVAANKQSE